MAGGRGRDRKSMSGRQIQRPRRPPYRRASHHELFKAITFTPAARESKEMTPPLTLPGERAPASEQTLPSTPDGEGVRKKVPPPATRSLQITFATLSFPSCFLHWLFLRGCSSMPLSSVPNFECWRARSVLPGQVY